MVITPAFSVINFKHCIVPCYTGKVIYLKCIIKYENGELNFFFSDLIKQSQINLFMLCLVRNHYAICLHPTQHMSFLDKSNRWDHTDSDKISCAQQ